MATLRPDQVRARVAAALDGLTLTTGTLGTLHEAPCGYDGMPRQVPDQLVHLAFGAAVLRTVPAPVQRQRQGRELRVESTIGVRLSHKRRRSDAVADEDAALAAETEAIVAVLGVSGADGLQVTYQGTSRRSASEQPESYLIEMDFSATYNLATT